MKRNYDIYRLSLSLLTEITKHLFYISEFFSSRRADTEYS